MVTQKDYDKALEIIEKIKEICSGKSCKDCPFNTYDVPYHCLFKRRIYPTSIDLNLLQTPQPLFTKEMVELIEAFKACYKPIENIQITSEQNKLEAGDIYYDKSTRTLNICPGLLASICRFRVLPQMKLNA